MIFSLLISIISSTVHQPLKDKKIAIVIFGASGDLSNRMLIPSLESISQYDPFHESTMVIGVSRTVYTDEEFQDQIAKSCIKFSRLHQACNDEKYENPCLTVSEDFLRRFKYISGEFNDPNIYKNIKTIIEEHDFEGVLVYLAIPPSVIELITDNLKSFGLTTNDKRWVRIIVEKPFGTSYKTALELNQSLYAKFNDDDVYRIDHYLAKDTVLNLFSFRWGNVIWEPLWNRNYIDHVEILVEEAIDVENRIGYYDNVSVIRDMIQSHLLQMLAIIAMEPPIEMNSKFIRDEKMKVLKSIRNLTKDDIILGQYAGYKEHKGVPENSTTPTFAYLRFYIDNWRWQGVPFYICSGKAMSEKKTSIKIVFKEIPQVLFDNSTIHKPNVLEINIQPKESIVLKQHVKIPGAGMQTKEVPLSFKFRDTFGDHALHGAYERVMLDAINGDQSFFPRCDEILQCWKIVEPLLKEKYPEIIPYEKKMNISNGSLKRNRGKNHGQRVAFKSPQELVNHATEQITKLIIETIAEQGVCNIALSGGQSPKPIYSLLTTDPYASRINFTKVHIWCVDERCVPPDHYMSNINMINETLLKFISIPEENVHRIAGEINETEAAKNYAEELKKHFNTEIPRFDIIILGMGPDGHTASLFPGTAAIRDKESIVISHFVSRFNMTRVTFSRRIINNARNVYCIVTDRERNSVVDLVFNGPYIPTVIPAQIVSPKNGNLTWYTVV